LTFTDEYVKIEEDCERRVDTMENVVMNVDVFPLFIREKIQTPTVSVQQKEGNIVLVPIDGARQADNVSVRPPFDFGCMKGKIRIPDDFNEPLDAFREYM
jgi:hypothetical protein